VGRGQGKGFVGPTLASGYDDRGELLRGASGNWCLDLGSEIGDGVVDRER